MECMVGKKNNNYIHFCSVSYGVHGRKKIIITFTFALFHNSVSGCPPSLNLLCLFLLGPGVFSGVVPGEVLGDVPLQSLINWVIKFSCILQSLVSVQYLRLLTPLVHSSVQYLRLLTPLVHSSVWYPHSSVSYLLLSIQ